MLFAVAALVALPAFGLGAPYAPARIVAAPERKGCYVRYRLSTDAPIASVAAFYRIEAARTGVALFDDTQAKFADYRNLTFIAQPKFMNVVIDRQEGRTNVFVGYKIGNASTCSTR
jgi:hypothetical protein